MDKSAWHRKLLFVLDHDASPPRDPEAEPWPFCYAHLLVAKGSQHGGRSPFTHQLFSPIWRQL